MSFEFDLCASHYICVENNRIIDAKTLRDLTQFGYSEKRAAKALIRANNDFNLALDVSANN